MSLPYLSLLSLLLLPAILTNASKDDTLRNVANGQITDEGLKEKENLGAMRTGNRDGGGVNGGVVRVSNIKVGVEGGRDLSF